MLKSNLKVACAVLAGMFFTGYLLAADSNDSTLFDEIVVTANRMPTKVKDLPTNVSVITSREIINTGAVNAAEALDKIEGLNVSETGTLGSERTVKLRSGGSAANQVLVMIDGMPVNDASLGSAELGSIPATDIERIEIVKGASSALYGANALGGVINIITKNPVKNGSTAKFNSNFGSFITRKYSGLYSFKNDKCALLFNVNKDYSLGWRENSEYNAIDLMLKGGLALSDNGRLGATVSYINTQTGVPGSNYTNISDYNNITERAASFSNALMNNYKLATQFNYEDGKSFLHSMVYNRLETRSYVNADSWTDTLSQTNITGFDIHADYSEEMMAGIDFHYDIFKRTDRLLNNIDIDKNLCNISVYFQEILSYNKLKATIVLRDDYHSVFGIQFNPGVILEYALVKGLCLTGNIGRAFRAPTFEDLYSPYTSWTVSSYGPAGDTQGFEGLNPETAIAMDAGVKYYIDNKLLCKLTLFRSDITNLIQWSDISNNPLYQKYRPQNIGNAYNTGIEAGIEQMLGKNITHRLGYTFIDSKGKGEFDTDFVSMNYAPKNNIYYYLDITPFSKTNITANAKYTSSQWSLSNQAGVELPAYLLLDLRLAQNAGPAEIFFSINNALDTKYKTRREYTLPGRYFTGGINLKI